MANFSYNSPIRRKRFNRFPDRGIDRFRNTFPKYSGKKWCMNHPNSIWNEGYSQCYQGWMKREPCKEGPIDDSIDE